MVKKKKTDDDSADKNVDQNRFFKAAEKREAEIRAKMREDNLSRRSPTAASSYAQAENTQPQKSAAADLQLEAEHIAQKARITTKFGPLKKTSKVQKKRVVEHYPESLGRLKKWVRSNLDMQYSSPAFDTNAAPSVRAGIIHLLAKNHEDRDTSDEEFEHIIRCCNSGNHYVNYKASTLKFGYPVALNKERLSEFADYLGLPNDLHEDFVDAMTPTARDRKRINTYLSTLRSH